MNFTPNKCQQTSIASCFFDTQKNKQSRFQNQQIPNTTRHLNHCHSFYQPSDQDLKKKFFQFTALTHQKIASNQNIVIQNVKYDVIRLIGQGNYGHVFLLKNDKTNELYAFKVQKQINKDEEKILLEFQGIKFKNLVNIIACLINVQTQEYFVLMEYCEQSLEDQLRQGKIDTKNVRYIMKSIANGIKELHDKNIIHRDIKPENILVFSITDGLNTQVCYKICDFGLSSTKSLSQTYRCGTSHYMAPEQIQCLKNKQIGYNNSVDIWALGAVIYELLTGDVFFMASSNDLIYELILNSDQESIDYKIKNKLGNLEYVNLLIKMMYG